MSTSGARLCLAAVPAAAFLASRPVLVADPVAGGLGAMRVGVSSFLRLDERRTESSMAAAGASDATES
jgi:hypothetical protein